MFVSFIVPAWNEEKVITECLQHIDAAVAACQDLLADKGAVERIVVDNNSADNTAELAEQAGARVVFEPQNQIARARNAGAKAAQGEWLIFIDADSHLSAGLLRDTLRLIAEGQFIGCGSLMHMDDVPFSFRLSFRIWSWISRVKRWAAGSYVMCRADAFNALGGFNEELFASEEIEFSRRINKYARKQGLQFTVLTEHPLWTSGRKATLYSKGELWKQFMHLVLHPINSIKSRSGLPVWYDGRR
ncbi:MAG: glycosyltransferase [Gammaproteobacteria bacterium]